MLNIETFTCNMLQENCYVVSDESKECVIIDCGAYYEAEKLAIEKYITDNHLKPVHLIAHTDTSTTTSAIRLLPRLMACRSRSTRRTLHLCAPQRSRLLSLA